MDKLTPKALATVMASCALSALLNSARKWILAKLVVSVQGVDMAFDEAADPTRSVPTAPGRQKLPTRSHRSPFLVEVQSS